MTTVTGQFAKNEGMTGDNQTANAGTTTTTATNPNLTQMATNNATMGTTANQTMTTNSNSNISLNIKIDSPPGVDASTLEKIFQDPVFKQTLLQAVETAAKQNGLTPSATGIVKK